MAKGNPNPNPANLFKKGNKLALGNGRPPLPPAIKDAWRLTTAELIGALCSLLEKNQAQIKAIVHDPATPTATLIVARIIMMSVNGEMPALNLLLERLIGKVPDKTELTTIEPPVLNFYDAPKKEDIP
jgi:hypothetical protein